jgi:tetratricopeptide (TPR) repeat protein
METIQGLASGNNRDESIRITNENQGKNQEIISIGKEGENENKILQTNEEDRELELEEKSNEKVRISNEEMTESPTNEDEAEEKPNLPQEELKRLYYMETIIRRKIENTLPNHPNLAGLQYNLSVILEKQGLYLQALDSSSKAVELAPNNVSYKQVHNRIKDAASKCKSKVDPIVEAERIKAAEQSYEEQEKEERTRKEENNAKKMERDEDENRENENIISLNRYVSNTFQKRNSYIEAKLIHSNAENITKSVFNSKIERNMYTILLEQFPNYVVYPNMALQNIFNYDKVKEILDDGDFEYFPKGSR